MREYRQEGNAAFAAGNFDLALNLYNLSLKDLNDDKESRIKCLNNKALCTFKLNQFDQCVQNCDEALSIDPNNIKAIYRKALALNELNQLKDALNIIVAAMKNNKLARKDESFCALYRQLTSMAMKQVEEQNSTAGKVQHCLNALQSTQPIDIKGLHGLNALTREKSGCECLLEKNGIELIKNLMSKNCFLEELYDILSNVAKQNKTMCSAILSFFELNSLIKTISSSNEWKLANSVTNLVDNLTFTFTDLEAKRKVKKPINVSFQFDKEEIEYIDNLFRTAGMLIGEGCCTAVGRDCLMALILKYCDQETSLSWSSRFIAFGIPKVLRIGASLENYPKYLALTEKTKMHATCLLSAIYDDLCSDKHREEYQNVCCDFIRQLIECDDANETVRAVSCLTTILRGPVDVGNIIIGTLGMINHIMKLAISGDHQQEQIALDAILMGSSKSDKAMGLLREGHEILRELYLSNDEEIRIRALLALCKLSSSKGSDCSKKTVADGSMEKLESTCIRYLETSKDTNIITHIADALSYLTLDGDCKEDLINNNEAMKSLFNLIQEDSTPQMNTSVCSIIFNLTNAEIVKKPDKEMIKLAQFSKQHIPQSHPKDSDECVLNRRKKLMDMNVTTILVKLAKEKSDFCRSMVSKICLALAEEPSHRGKMVAAGLGKALLPISVNECTGKIQASQAIARLAISCNPEMAFPGQRVIEVVRPLIQLLHPDRSGLENFEALLALTNLASISKSVRKKIIDDGFSSIEQYMFEDHLLLRRAATEVICNLCVDDQVYSKFTSENDRVRLLVLYANENDVQLNKAACGALAQLSILHEVCIKISETKDFIEILKAVSTTSDADLQLRAFVIIQNLINDSREIAALIVDSDLMDIVFAMSRLDDNDRLKVIKLSCDIVKTCMEKEYVKPLTEAFN